MAINLRRVASPSYSLISARVDSPFVELHGDDGPSSPAEGKSPPKQKVRDTYVRR